MVWPRALALCGVVLNIAKPLERAPAPRADSTTGVLASLPAEILLGGGVLLQARINGSGPHTFALDSAGGSGFIVDARLAKTLRLALQGRALSSGVGGNSIPVAFAKGVRLELSDVVLPRETVAVIDLASLEPLSGRRLSGIIGYGLFAHYVVKIDYGARRVDLYPFDGYRYSGEGTILPLRIEKQHFYVAARVRMPGRDPIDGEFMLDTGAPMTSVAFNRPAVERFRLLESLKGRIVDRSFAGLGGETAEILGRASELDLGDLRIPNLTVTFSQDTAGTLASKDFDGVIGGELLRRFTVIFDSPHRRLILEKNGHFGDPFEHNMSGIALRAEGSHRRTSLRIHRIVAGSPAAEAGLREGDRLEAIDGRPAAGFTLDQLYEMFKREGREYVLDVRRGSVTLRTRVRLRRLI